MCVCVLQGMKAAQRILKSRIDLTKQTQGWMARIWHGKNNSVMTEGTCFIPKFGSFIPFIILSRIKHVI